MFPGIFWTRLLRQIGNDLTASEKWCRHHGSLFLKCKQCVSIILSETVLMPKFLLVAIKIDRVASRDVCQTFAQNARCGLVLTPSLPHILRREQSVSLFVNLVTDEFIETLQRCDRHRETPFQSATLYQRPGLLLLDVGEFRLTESLGPSRRCP